MAAAGADGIGVRLALAVAMALGVAVAVLWATGQRTGLDYLVPGGAGPSAAVIQEDFGPGSAPPGRTGYDGQQFYAIARYFPDLDAAAEQLDAPRYRLLRVLAPALASLAPPGQATAAVLVALNVLGIGVACGATATLAGRHGMPAAAGVAAGVPLLPALVVGTVEPAAFGLGLLGIALADQRRHGLAVLAFVAAALTRETAAAMALATGFGLLLGGLRHPRRLALYCIPAFAVLAWHLVLGRLVGGALPDRVDLLYVFDLAGTTVALVMAMTAVAALGTWLWRRAPVVWPVSALFALWTPFYSSGTWDWLALTRVNAPAIALALAGVFGTAARPAGRSRA